MNSLEEKLREILHNRRYQQEDKPYYWDIIEQNIQQIVQAFKDEGWVSPENAKEVQDMVNQMANLAQDAFKLPSVMHLAVSKDQKTAQKLMTGQEWLGRFQREFDELPSKATDYQIYIAAQRASGISSEEEE